jgi:hypothetical protein
VSIKTKREEKQTEISRKMLLKSGAFRVGFFFKYQNVTSNLVHDVPSVLTYIEKCSMLREI